MAALMFVKFVTRAPEWWRFKLPPVLAFVYLVALERNLGVLQGAGIAALVLVCMASAASFGYMLNDCCDIESDRLANKPNAMAACHWRQRALLLLFCPLAGLISASWWGNPVLLLLLHANFAISILYSVRPWRLKERGIAGVVADALAAHLLPVGFVLALLSDQASATVGPMALAWLTWALLLGLRGILAHMLSDLAGDRKAQVRTFVSRGAGELHDVAARVRRALRRLLAAELTAFAAVMALAPVSRCTALGGMAVYVLLESGRAAMWPKRLPTAAALRQLWLRDPPFLDNEFYATWLPTLLLLKLAATETAWLPVACIHVALFPKGYGLLVRRHGGPSRGFFDAATRRLAQWKYGWVLEPASCASLHRIPDSGHIAAALQVRPLPGSGQPWDGRLVARRLVPGAGRSCRYSFMARANAPRTVFIGAWQADSPWENVGLWKQIHLDTHWTTVDETFIPTRSRESVYFGLWFGHESSAFDLSRPVVESSPLPIQPTGPCKHESP